MSTNLVIPEATASNPINQTLFPTQPSASLNGQTGVNGQATTEQLCSTIKNISIDSICMDGTFQVREQTAPERVEKYAALMAEQIEFPPIVLFDDGNRLWPGDGKHRTLAAQRNEYKTIRAEVRPGTERDAFLYGLQVNAAHGLSLTDDEKRAAVDRMLVDPEWCTWSDREIARQCGVTHPAVGKRRQKMTGNTFQLSHKRKVKRGDKTITMDTTNIGKRKKSPQQPGGRANGNPPGKNENIPNTMTQDEIPNQPEPAAQPVNESKSEHGNNNGKSGEDDDNQSEEQLLVESPEVGTQDVDDTPEPIKEADENGNQAAPEMTIVSASDNEDVAQDDGVGLPTVAKEIEQFLCDRYPNTLFAFDLDSEQLIIRLIGDVETITSSASEPYTEADTHSQDDNVEETVAEDAVSSALGEPSDIETPVLSDEASSSEMSPDSAEDMDAYTLVKAFIAERCQPSSASVPHDDIKQAFTGWLQQHGRASLTESKVTDALHRLKYKDVYTKDSGWRWEGLELLPSDVPVNVVATAEASNV